MSRTNPAYDEDRMEAQRDRNAQTVMDDWVRDDLDPEGEQGVIA